ncbi:hypothetical protein [Kocuria arenosa]|uniref:hypothetical protein n=1 Tax=Kocuria arenosa TaxID=3071446 RepID=UPI0034D58C69
MEFKWLAVQPGLEIPVPSDTHRVQSQGIDSTVYTFESGNLEITVDVGPFADRLQPGNRAGACVAAEKTGDLAVRIATFVAPDGTSVAAAHLETAPTAGLTAVPVTILVRGRAGTAVDVPLRVVRGLRAPPTTTAPQDETS